MTTVLKNCKQLLKNVGLCGAPCCVLYGRKVPKLIIQLSCLFVFLMSYIPMTIYTIEVQSYSFTQINSALYVSIGAGLILVSYTDFIRKTVPIQFALGHLEQVVLRSK